MIDVSRGTVLQSYYSVAGLLLGESSMGAFYEAPCGQDHFSKADVI